MTMNFQAVIKNNSIIGAEFAKTGRMISGPGEEFPLYLLKKSQQSAQLEAATLKYESRKNSCPTCNIALPLTGKCDDCA